MNPRHPHSSPRPLLRRPISRRAALGVGFAAAVLAGCSDNITGIRWEHLPDPTMLPTSPDEALRAQTRSLLLSLADTVAAAPANPDLDALADQIGHTLQALGPEWDQFPGYDPSAVPGLTLTTTPPSADGGNDTALTGNDGTGQSAEADSNEPGDDAADDETTEGGVAAVVHAAKAAYTDLMPHLALASAPYAALCGTIAASLRVWGQWLSTSDRPLPPPTASSPPAPDSTTAEPTRDDETPWGTVELALAVRHAASYHYGVLAGQHEDTREVFSARLQQVDAEIQLLTQFAVDRGTTIPAAQPAYAQLATADVMQLRVELDRACTQADTQSLQDSLPADREWLCQILTRSTSALAGALGEPPKAVSLR